MSEQDNKRVTPAADCAAPAENSVENDTKVAAAGSRQDGAARNTGKGTSKKRRKKRRKSGIPVQLAIILLVVALLFGAILGYAIGHSSSATQLKEAEATIAALQNPAPVDAEGTIAATDEALSADNQTALADLSGAGLESESDASPLIGEDNLVSGESGASGAAPVVVAEFNGGTLMSDEVQAEYNSQLATYIFDGYTETDASELLNDVLNYMVSDRVLEMHAEEMGLYTLSSADYDQIETEATQSYNEQLAYYTDFVRTEGMSDADAETAAKTYMEESEGISYDTLYADLEAGWWQQKLYDAIVKDVAVSSEDILNTYNEKLADQKSSFAEYPEEYEYAQSSGETIVYNLPDYRAVQTLLIGFEDNYTGEQVAEINGEIALLDATADADKIADYQNQLNVLFAAAESRAQGLYEQLNAGADFEVMLVQYGADEGMKDSALRASGYYISANSVIYDANLIAAAMALNNAGDISEPVRTDNGICILRYLGNVTPGDVSINDIYDRISAETLETAQYDAYEAQVSAWLSEANPVYYPERMQ